MRVIIVCFVTLILMQLGFWYQTKRIMPDMAILPEVPGEETVQAIALGDVQSLFRFYALRIQNAGDTFGRTTSLKAYDYNKLNHWLDILDTMDNRSDYTPSLASYYFGKTPKTEDLQYIIDYLVEHTKGREETKWWWVTQAAYIANHRLKDKEQAVQIAKTLEGKTTIPLWAQQLPAFIYEQLGEYEMAYRIIRDIFDNVDNLPEHELRFMEHFIRERLRVMEGQ